MKKVTTTTTTVVTEEVTNKGVLACYVLDMSSSMADMQKQVISGFNEWLETVKREKAVDFVTLAVFSTAVEFIYTATPIADVKPIDEKLYSPNGWTALHDGIVEAVQSTERKLSSRGFEKALVIVMTDGQENSSRKHTLRDVQQLLSRKEEAGNWTFTFLGATPDAFNVGATFGFKRDNILRYNVERSEDIFRGITSNSIHYSKSAAPASASFLANMNADGELTGEYKETTGEDNG